MPAAVVGGVEMLGVACGIITFVTRSCVVTTDSRQHCPECYRVKTWGDHRRHLATQPIPHGTPACMKSCEVYHMQSDSPVWRKYSTHDSGCLSSVWATAHWTTRQSRMWHRWQAWSRICTVMDYMKLTLKFINWDASCLLYPLAVKDEYDRWWTTQWFYADGSGKEHSDGIGLADICGYVCSKTQKTETLEQTRMKLFWVCVSFVTVAEL